MLDLKRNHDFQVFISPKNNQTTEINPPSFNWPQIEYKERYTIELEGIDNTFLKTWQEVSSPFQIPFLLEEGEYRWRVLDKENKSSSWLNFKVAKSSENYLPPTAIELFELSNNYNQFIMYLDEDLDEISTASTLVYNKLKETAEKVNIEKITYPTHYRRGLEDGKRTAITNVREWIDRDLISLALLYRIWGDTASGALGVDLFLRLAEWSPEGPASLLRPCTWGDEVGCSLARNMYLAYHWLSPLLTDSEKDFVRPMLVRIAHQMENRLEEDMFKQYPGHSHTSRLPAYLGVAALVLHKEYDKGICERWLNYALMIYRGILPFYGGADGSWVEGPFYSSSYSKWFHPFFLTVERLSGFSFYNHPFYKNYYKFAMDFVVNEDEIHPFGDGFWCKRDGQEWPGFFAQNPLRIYADRFGDNHSKKKCRELEKKIDWYRLHLLDVVPTINQLAARRKTIIKDDKELDRKNYYKYYSFAGLGKLTVRENNLYFRASQFGNSSHRHGDQGNIALIDSGDIVLAPSGSYGYKFGSGHHKKWTRTTRAHNLPLVDTIGQILDNELATASVLNHKSGINWHFLQLNLSRAYGDNVNFIRNILLVEEKGIIVCDKILLKQEGTIQWRLHSHLDTNERDNKLYLNGDNSNYEIKLLSHKKVKPTIEYGYEEDNTHGGKVISDATEDIYHMQWDIEKKKDHLIVASCLKKPLTHSLDENDILRVELDKEIIIIDTNNDFIKIVN